MLNLHKQTFLICLGGNSQSNIFFSQHINLHRCLHWVLQTSLCPSLLGSSTGTGRWLCTCWGWGWNRRHTRSEKNTTQNLTLWCCIFCSSSVLILCMKFRFPTFRKVSTEKQYSKISSAFCDGTKSTDSSPWFWTTAPKKEKNHHAGRLVSAHLQSRGR